MSDAERIRGHLVEWVGERVAYARSRGETLLAIELTPSQWQAVVDYFSRKVTAEFQARVESFQEVQIQGVWLRPFDEYDVAAMGLT